MAKPGASFTKSKAFRDAALRSEVYRAYGVIAVTVLIGLAIFVPLPEHRLDPSIRVAAAGGLSAILMVQLAVLWAARWARVRQRSIPTWVEVGTLIVECLIPTGIILWEVLQGTLPPYASLSSPALMAYSIFILLTTLRIKPVLCLVAGTICAAGYAGLLIYIRFGQGIRQPSTGLPLNGYINTTIVIFISGLAAAWVAKEIRRHLEAALTEAQEKARIEGDLSAARTIQRALLPKGSPAVPGYEIAGWNRSADTTGGDYYDWQQLPDGRWMVTLADVSGHGIGPALVTAACRAYVRASSYYNADLASLTERMNRLLADDLPDGRFVTMVSVVIDPRAGGGGPVHMLSAGHGPIVLYVGSTGTVKDIQPQDLPLAVMADSRFGPAMAVELGTGDVLALVTDGFVEWARGGKGPREQFGIERLREALRRHAGLGAQEIIEAVARDVAAFAQGEPQQDDLTMVVVKKI